MKCKHCGGNLSFEVKYCPYCGRPNEEAIQHLKDMEKYQKEFTSTKADVYRAAERYSGLTGRLIVIIALIVIGIALLVTDARLYSIRRSYKSWRAASKYETNVEILDNFIANREFIELSRFAEDNYLSYLSVGDKYEDYQMVIRVANHYTYCCERLMGFTDVDKLKDDLSNYSWMYSSLASAIESFYTSAQKDCYQYYPEATTGEKMMEAVDRMKESLNGMLQTYLNISEEEAAGLADMSEGKRGYLIEEAITKMVEAAE